MNEPVPVLNRFFRMVVQDLPTNGPPEIFYSIKGLNAPTVQVKESYSPGGFDKVFDLPTASQAGTLVLKRPLLQDKTNITQWCEVCLQDFKFKPTVAYIFVLNYEESIVTQWTAEGIYPLGIKSSSLGTETNDGVVVEETITLAYASLTRS